MKKKNADSREEAFTRLKNGIATPEEQKLMHAELVTTISKLSVALKQITALQQRRAPVRIKISTEGQCASANDCFIEGMKKAQREHWIDAHDLFVSKQGRAYALVDTATRVYYMDCITGSLFNGAGGCMTSASVTEDFRRDRVAAIAFLSRAWTGSTEAKGDGDGDE